MPKLKRARTYTKRRGGAVNLWDLADKNNTIHPPWRREPAAAPVIANKPTKPTGRDIMPKVDPKFDRFAGRGAKLTSAEVRKLREKGHIVPIPIAGMPDKTAEHEALLRGTGIKDVAKKILKYGAPIALGLAGAVGAHYLNKKRAPETGDSRYTDPTLPFADSHESSYRERLPSDRVNLTPSSIKALLAFKALHSAYEPSAHHPWTAGGAIGVDEKMHHLMGCSVCKGKGIGRQLWNGVKRVGSEIYGGVKEIGKASLPYVIPIGLAAAAAGAGHYYINKNGIIPKIFDTAIKIGDDTLRTINPGFETRLAEHAASPASVAYEQVGRYNNPFDRPAEQKGYW